MTYSDRTIEIKR